MTKLSRRLLLQGTTAAAASAALTAPALLRWSQAFGADAGGVMMWAVQTLAPNAVAELSAKAGPAAPIVSAVVGEALTNLGVMAPGDDAALGQVLEQLQQINQTLKSIENQVEGLQRQLSMVQKSVEAHTSEERLKEHVNALDDLFADGASGTSLTSLLARARSRTLDAQTVQTFRTRAPRRVQASIDGIRHTLATRVAGNNPLLQQWTDLLVARMRLVPRPLENPDFVKLKRSYQLLESYFLQALAAQLKGVAVLAVASGGSPAEGLSRARQAFLPTLKLESEWFVWSVERLVLSQVTPFARQREALEIFRRADLLTNGLSAVLQDQAGPTEEVFGGVYGRIFCSSKKPAQPGRAGTVAINGIEIPGRIPDIETGMPCVGWRDSAPPYFQIMPANETQLQIVRVRRPGKGFHPGMLNSLVPLGLAGFASTDLFGNLDLGTLEFAGQGFKPPTPTAVRAVAFWDTAPLQSTLPPPTPITTRQSTEQRQSLVARIDRVSAAGNGIARPIAGQPAIRQSFVLHVAVSNRTPFSGVAQQVFRRPLFSVVEEEQLAIWVEGTVQDRIIDPRYNEAPPVKNRLTMALVGTDGSSVQIYDSQGSTMDVWDRPPSFDVKALITSFVPFTAKPDVQYDLQSTFVTSTGNRSSSPHALDWTSEELVLEIERLAIVRPPGAGIDL